MVTPQYDWIMRLNVKKISENDIIRIMSDLFLFFYKYGIYLGDINSDQILIKKR